MRANNDEVLSDWSDASDAVKTNAEMSTPTCTLNTGDLWCGVVTVALHTLGGFDLAYGFVDASASTNTSDTGALSDETFSVGTNNYTIDVVTVGIDSNVGNLAFSLTSDLTAADKEKLVLHVGSRSFAFSDATANTAFTYLWHLSGLDWSSETSVTLRLRANTAPVFADASATREVAENSAVGTSVGAVVTATDADNDTLTYSLEGTDAASFEIDSGTGQIKTKSGVTYNFEATKNSYSVTVKASDGTASATIAVTIDVTDVNEKSAKPDKPTLAAVTGSSTSLTATWTKPDLNGGPDIAGYDLQYRVGTTGTWMDFAHSDTAVTTTVTGLTADTSYQVQVRAKNGETDSDWSDPSDAVKTNAAGVTCTDNDIDLVRGMDSSEGSVQICHDNEQRSVCDDSFDQSAAAEVANGWAFAGVVCRQLGYATGPRRKRRTSARRLSRELLAGRGGVHRLGGQSRRLHARRLGSAGLFLQRAGGRGVHGGRNGADGDGRRRGGGDLAWDAPGADPGITRHEYRYKTTGGTYPAAWTPVPDSAADETNEASHTVTGLAAGTGYDFELRIVGGSPTRARGRGDREDDRGGRADELHGDGRRRAGHAVVGRAGDGFGRDETPVPPEDDGELSRDLDGHPEQRGGRSERGEPYGDDEHRQRHGLHLRVARGEGRHQQRSSRGGSGDADGRDAPDLHAEHRRPLVRRGDGGQFHTVGGFQVLGMATMDASVSTNTSG